MNKNFLLTSCLLLNLNSLWLANYKLVVITPESVVEAKKWEIDQEIAVKLETVNGNTIGLSHWSPELAVTSVPLL